MSLCALCRNKVVIRVDYLDGTLYDLGICSCPLGQRWRGPARSALATFYGLAEDRVWLVEDLLEPEELTGTRAAAAQGDFIKAGQMQRAKL